jgi:hypothetical protein
MKYFTPRLWLQSGIRPAVRRRIGTKPSPINPVWFSLIVDQVSFNGAAQIRVNGVNRWTYGTSAHGDLNIRNNLSWIFGRPAVYAGNTRIAFCDSTARSVSPNIDLLAVSSSGPAQGPSQILNHEVVLTGSANATWTIEVIRINRTETTVGMGVAVTGACCSAWSADTGGACQ